MKTFDLWINQSRLAKCSSDCGTTHSLTIFCHWLNQSVVLSPPVHPGGAPHQQVPVQPGGPAAPVPGGGVWPTCQQPSTHQTAGMSPFSSSPFTHRHGHTRFYSNVVKLIVLCRWSVSWTSSQEGLSVTSWRPRTSSRVIKDGRNVFPHGSDA